MHRLMHRKRYATPITRKYQHKRSSFCCLFFNLQDGGTALHLAALEGHVNVVEVLTNAQAPIDISTKVYKKHTAAYFYSVS